MVVTTQKRCKVLKYKKREILLVRGESTVGQGKG